MSDNARTAGKKELALAALAAGKSARATAADLELSEATLYRWLKQPSFTGRLAEIRRQMASAALGRLLESMTQAADTLANLLKSESDAVKLGAARTLLEIVGRVRADVEFAEELRQLREMVGAAGKSQD